MKTNFFQSCGHCWVFRICWRLECSTFTAASFRIWNSSTGILSPPVALFIVMRPKAHLTSHSRTSGSRWVITPWWLSSVQFSSVAQSCPTLCDPMNRSTPGLPVHHQLPEFTQTHVRRVSDAIQPSHPRSSPSSPAQTILSFLFSWMFISWISVEFCPRHFQHL